MVCPRPSDYKDAALCSLMLGGGHYWIGLWSATYGISLHYMAYILFSRCLCQSPSFLIWNIGFHLLLFSTVTYFYLISHTIAIPLLRYNLKFLWGLNQDKWRLWCELERLHPLQRNRTMWGGFLLQTWKNGAYLMMPFANSQKTGAVLVKVKGQRSGTCRSCIPLKWNSSPFFPLIQ